MFRRETGESLSFSRRECVTNCQRTSIKCLMYLGGSRFGNTCVSVCANGIDCRVTSFARGETGGARLQLWPFGCAGTRFIVYRHTCRRNNCKFFQILSNRITSLPLLDPPPSQIHTNKLYHARWRIEIASPNRVRELYYTISLVLRSNVFYCWQRIFTFHEIVLIPLTY